MKKRILVTGGAGFIGSHLCDEMLARDYRVRVLDNLSPQVHGHAATPPAYLSEDVEFIRGDVRDARAVSAALEDVWGVFHLAAAVGVGQSMYEIEHYTSVNSMGTAVLLEALIKRPVRKLVVASSMSVYGEGLYRDSKGVLRTSAVRTEQQLRRGQWNLTDEDGCELEPAATPESKSRDIGSIYALGKYEQEQMCLITGRAYRFDVTALRFFNVYGTRQALSNPYTGVLAIFASRYLNDLAPMIYEDGLQRRDFVSVRDVARACRLAFESPRSAHQVFNIGSGQSYTVLEIAEKMGRLLGKSHIRPQITGKYRVGDIRHCFSDISLARAKLNFLPHVDFEEGLKELSVWLKGQAAVNKLEIAHRELDRRGLTYALQTAE
jgi:dTDP-L-rhamnose 4-epimerase